MTPACAVDSDSARDDGCPLVLPIDALLTAVAIPPPAAQRRWAAPWRKSLRALTVSLIVITVILGLFAGAAGKARAQSATPEGVEVSNLSVARTDQGLTLDFAARIWPNRTVEDALQRGIPVYFIAEAVVYRPRWYWRDERVSRVSRSWRVSFQPLTSSWRVGSGGLSQTVGSQAEALALVSRFSGWKITDSGHLPVDQRFYVEFAYRLDTSQLPRPMQLSVGALNEWALEFERNLTVD